MSTKIYLVILAICLAFYSHGQTSRELHRFSKELEHLRNEMKIPGMSAAIVKNGKLIWSEGFGYADRELKKEATPNTPYHIASITKPIAATIFLQLLEQGKLSLDDPIKKYYPKDFGTETVHLRHIITHTAGIHNGGKPGDVYQYSGSWYGYIAKAIETITGQSFRDELIHRVLEPLGMNNSVPGHDIFEVKPSPFDRYAEGSADRYKKTLSDLAKPYTLYGKNEKVLSPYPPSFIGSSAGLISTVVDLAKFDNAIDNHVLIKQQTQDSAWTNSRNNFGEKIPYGLGWFVQETNGTKLIWHYGQWPVFSGLYLKVPEKQITLILLANSNGLSAPFDLDKGNILASSFALTFLKRFAFPGKDFSEESERAKALVQRYLNDRMSKTRKN